MTAFTLLKVHFADNTHRSLFFFSKILNAVFLVVMEYSYCVLASFT